MNPHDLDAVIGPPPPGTRRIVVHLSNAQEVRETCVSDVAVDLRNGIPILTREPDPGRAPSTSDKEQT